MPTVMKKESGKKADLVRFAKKKKNKSTFSNTRDFINPAAFRVGVRHRMAKWQRAGSEEEDGSSKGNHGFKGTQ